MSNKYKVVIVGAGAAGQVIGKRLIRAGHQVVAIASRSASSAGAARAFLGQGEVCSSAAEAVRRGNLVWITTPDDAMESVCRDIAKQKGFQKDSLVVHCSGNYSSDILASARQSGARVGSIHPLRSMADVAAAAEQFDGTFCGYEGDSETMPALERLVADLGGRGIPLNRDAKVLYHSAAVFASNYLVVLFDMAQRLFQAAGVSPELSREALASLSMGTVKNLANRGAPAALTGPVERGDLNTLRRHLDALGAFDRPIGRLYAQMGLRAVDVAMRKGSIPPDRGRELKDLFQSMEGES